MWLNKKRLMASRENKTDNIISFKKKIRKKKNPHRCQRRKFFRWFAHFCFFFGRWFRRSRYCCLYHFYSSLTPQYLATKDWCTSTKWAACNEHANFSIWMEFRERQGYMAKDWSMNIYIEYNKWSKIEIMKFGNSKIFIKW